MTNMAVLFVSLQMSSASLVRVPGKVRHSGDDVLTWLTGGRYLWLEAWPEAAAKADRRR